MPATSAILQPLKVETGVVVTHLPLKPTVPEKPGARQESYWVGKYGASILTSLRTGQRIRGSPTPAKTSSSKHPPALRCQRETSTSRAGRSYSLLEFTVTRRLPFIDVPIEGDSRYCIRMIQYHCRRKAWRRWPTIEAPINAHASEKSSPSHRQVCFRDFRPSATRSHRNLSWQPLQT